ncbi:tetratricopeptide repeat protein [Streptomyces sp. NPDC002250]|uniref:tetratricopeptide repeat protein n=1 Tax=Streptomyces sp. NPDC002250 TaxID=3364641 RepID=UPI0036C4CBEB
MATAALPAVPAGFTGRDEDLARLMPVLDPGAESDLPVVICAVSGLGGIGKTSLALCAAHRAVAQGWFPGGALFVDFRGYDKNPVTADQALVALLDGMGVPVAELPHTVAAQYGLFRRLLAQERQPMLLILDNASRASQIAPLVPGADHHRVLITSRDRLTDLDARLLDLDVLKPEAAAELIDRSLRLSDGGDDRAGREPEAVAELAVLCGHHPLALRIAVGMLRKRRYRGIASLVGELRRAEDRAGALGVRPILEVACAQLPAEQARLLRLVCVAPTAEMGSEVAGVLAGLGPDQTTGLLEELASSHLVTPVPTGGGVRWRVHDLVRAFAGRAATKNAKSRKETEEARERLLTFYRQRADAANAHLLWLPGKPVPERFADRAEALAWLDGERASLVAAVQWAGEDRHARTAVALASCLEEYLRWRRHFDDGLSVARTAQGAAHSAGDRLREGCAWNDLGLALLGVGREEEAVDAHTRARDLFQAIGDSYREAMAWNNLGSALRKTGSAEKAIDAHTRARDLCQAIGDHQREATVWNNLGMALRQAGWLEDAIKAFTRARDLYQAVGDRHGEGRAWNNLGNALRKSSRAEQAIEAYSKALQTHREFEDWYGAARTLSNLARAHQAGHRLSEARTYYLQAADAYTRADAPTEAAHARSAADTLT